MNIWHYDPKAADCKCSFCGDIRFGVATDWTSCDDIGERHPTHVIYAVCPRCQSAVADAVERVLQGEAFSPAMDDDDIPEPGQARDQSE